MKSTVLHGAAIGISLCCGIYVALSANALFSSNVALRLAKAPSSISVMALVAAPAPIRAPSGHLALSVLPIRSEHPIELSAIQSAKRLKERHHYDDNGTIRSSAIDDNAQWSRSEGALQADSVSRRFPEQPGGLVLVLGLLVNSSSMVLDARILVPSANPLTDSAVLDAAIGNRWPEPIIPPLARGESRWIEFRINFQPKDALGNLIP